jgi:BMFP domain-containing protein YqiC
LVVIQLGVAFSATPFFLRRETAATALDKHRPGDYVWAMIDPRIIDDLSRRMADSLPSGLATLQDDVRRNARAALQAGLGRLDLVTREEFEVQQAVLARTREKLEALENRIAELEALARQRNG